MKKVLGILLILVGILGGLYVGGWLMFIQPIVDCCKAFDLHTLTGLMVGTTVLKCLFASVVGSVIFYLGTTTGGALMGHAKRKFRKR